MKLTHDQADEICFEDDTEDGLFEFVKKQKTGSSRWMNFYEFIFKEVATGKFYAFSIGLGKDENCDSEDIPESGMDCYEVEPKPVTVITYVAKKE